MQALEKARSDVLFKCAYLVAHGALGKSQLRCRLGEREMPGDRLEGPQRPKRRKRTIRAGHRRYLT
jgi:hypothetical protein